MIIGELSMVVEVACEVCGQSVSLPPARSAAE